MHPLCEEMLSCTSTAVQQYSSTAVRGVGCRRVKVIPGCWLLPCLLLHLGMVFGAGIIDLTRIEVCCV